MKLWHSLHKLFGLQHLIYRSQHSFLGQGFASGKLRKDPWAVFQIYCLSFQRDFSLHLELLLRIVLVLVEGLCRLQPDCECSAKAC
jgi:hypothetical protein